MPGPLNAHQFPRTWIDIHPSTPAAGESINGEVAWFGSSNGLEFDWDIKLVQNASDKGGHRISNQHARPKLHHYYFCWC